MLLLTLRVFADAQAEMSLFKIHHAHPTFNTVIESVISLEQSDNHSFLATLFYNLSIVSLS